MKWQLIATLAVLAAAGAGAQEAPLRRADSAFAAEDRALSRRLYEDALRANPRASRAVFRLAQLQESLDSAATLLRQYVALEPQDPWGYMALGDCLARMGHVDQALTAYEVAAGLAPDERDVAIGRARVLQRAGRAREVRDVLDQWTRRHPDDVEARQMHRRARSLSAPAIEPVVAYQRDSDGNRTTRTGARAEVALSDMARGGVLLTRGAIADALESVSWDAAALSLAVRPAPRLRLDLDAGAQRFTTPHSQWVTPAFDARLRWRAPNEATLELRGQQLPLGTAPLLVTNRVTRREARARLDIPAGALRVRTTTRAAQLQASQDGSNRRLDNALALVAPLGTRSEVAAGYRHVTFQRASGAGYFAPRLAQAFETGAYFELESTSRLSLAADLGGGMQRVALHGETPGAWKPALRAWLYSALILGPARALWTELEAYDAPLAPAGVSTTSSWRFISLAAGLRWSLQ